VWDKILETAAADEFVGNDGAYQRTRVAQSISKGAQAGTHNFFTGTSAGVQQITDNRAESAGCDSHHRLPGAQVKPLGTIRASITPEVRHGPLP
jgi:hypothetical protein